MSIAIDNFTKQLHDNLEAVEARVKSLKESIQSIPKKTQTEIQAKFHEAKAKLDSKKQEFDEYRAKLKTQFEEKESEVKSNVEDWKANREVQKLEHRANKAEDHATTAIFLAIATLEEAEKATLEAISSRLDAETAAGTTTKTSNHEATSSIKTHSHQHGPNCGHTGIQHDDHVDYLHDGELHHHNGEQTENHVLPVNANNPESCTPKHKCSGHEATHVHGPGCGHEAVPHGDHIDYLVDDHLHHPHGDHCDNHGLVSLVSK